MPYQDVTRPVGESDGEEENTAIDVGTTVSRHGGMRVSSIPSHRCKTRGHGVQEHAFAHPTSSVIFVSIQMELAEPRDGPR